MRSIVTAVIAAIEAVAVALAGLLLIAVPVLLLWILAFGLSAEPAAVFGTITGVWLLGHLVPLELSLDAEAALGFGLPPEALAFTVSLAPLGLTVLTAVLAARAGSRFGARGGTGAAGVLGGALGFGVVAFAAATIAGAIVARPLAVAAIVPAAVYAGASGTAFLARAVRDGHPWWRATVRAALRGLEYLGLRTGTLPARTAEAFRLAGAALLGFGCVAALGLAVALILGYADVIGLSQRLQLDPLGSVAVFLAQLALLPVALVWSGSWLTGAGFSIGAGSSVTPFESLLGPLPALPLFGAIPSGWGGFGALAPTILVVCGVLIGALFARREVLRRAPWAVALGVPVVAAALAGAVIAGAAALASGAIGPDRMQTVGADPWAVGGLAALELGGGLLIGAAVGRVDYARLRDRLPEAVPAAAALLGAARVRADPGHRAPEDGSDDGASGAHWSAAGVSERDGGADPAELPTEDLDAVRRSRRWGVRVSRADGRPAGDGRADSDGADSGWGDIVLDEIGPDDPGSDAAQALDPDPEAAGSEDEPFDDDRSDDDHGWESRTEPLDDVLFDQEDESRGGAGDAGDGTGAPGTEGSDPEAAARAAEEAEAEALLRAYSWDRRSDEPQDDAAGGSGWRFPRRKR